MRGIIPKGNIFPLRTRVRTWPPRPRGPPWMIMWREQRRDGTGSCPNYSSDGLRSHRYIRKVWLRRTETVDLRTPPVVTPLSLVERYDRPRRPPVPHMVSEAVRRVRCNRSFPIGKWQRESWLKTSSPKSTKSMPTTAYHGSIKGPVLCEKTSVSPPTIPYFSCPQHVSVISAPMWQKF